MQRGRKASRGEGCVKEPTTKLLGGFSVGGHESEVEPPEPETNGFARRMDERSRRSLGAFGMVVGVLSKKDGGWTQRCSSRLRPLSGGPRTRSSRPFLPALRGSGGRPLAFPALTRRALQMRPRRGYRLERKAPVSSYPRISSASRVSRSGTRASVLLANVRRLTGDVPGAEKGLSC